MHILLQLKAPQYWKLKHKTKHSPMLLTAIMIKDKTLTKTPWAQEYWTSFLLVPQGIFLGCKQGSTTGKMLPSVLCTWSVLSTKLGHNILYFPFMTHHNYNFLVSWIKNSVKVRTIESCYWMHIWCPAYGIVYNR